MIGKKNQNAKHVEKKYHLLVSVLQKPQDYRTHSVLGKALRRQSTFSEFSDPELELAGCSINTFKSCAEAVVPGGFKVVDNLRLQALKLFDETTGPNERSDTVRSLQKKIKLQEENIQHLEEHVLRMTYVHRKVMHMYNRIADLPLELVRPAYVKDRAEIYSVIAALELVEFWDLV
ncbi:MULTISPECIES: hypothetical protein [Pseudomonas syringae group]|uniref:Uncharacterized protein n=1 Tax=Pseudomonas asturiensis TaxID=1190415 RepID=A0ABX6HER2_9PSED|nr:MULTISPECIES: hypothetical protein [Pseudomonas syringae group]QHF03868.1 hypothetical protein N015_16190 [Pseudomonas asturiensis]QXG39126.1 hypothetical protein KTT55_17265 [Pseudomonas viridiflava]